MRHVQLRAFHNVALHGGFSRAAQAMGLSQPALSDQVRKLELEYDLMLFDRSHKQVVLTDKGRKLFAITMRLFEAELQAREFLSESRALTAGRLRIIADSAYHLTEVLHRFRAQHPKVQILMRSGNSQDVIDALAAYQADIGVLGNMEADANFSAVKLGATPIIAFARRGFARLPRPPAPLAQLAALPLVLREKGSKTRKKLEDAAQARGISLRPAIEAEGREAVREIVASGAGVGFVSEAEFGHDDRLVRIPIAGPVIPMEETVICLASRSEVRMIRIFMGMAAQLAHPDRQG